MKEILKTTIITLLIFASGLGIGIWLRPAQPELPPPPFGPLPEFGDKGRGSPFDMDRLPREKLKEMREQMEKAKPQIEAFQAKLEVIREESRNKIRAILREDQKKQFDAMQEQLQKMADPKCFRDLRQKVKARFGHQPPRQEQSPLAKDDQPRRPMVRHFEFLNTIIYKPLLEKMAQDLKLDENQKKSCEEILQQRRKAVLDLIDSFPPPSMHMLMPPPPHQPRNGQPMPPHGAPQDDQPFDDHERGMLPPPQQEEGVPPAP